MSDDTAATHGGEIEVINDGEGLAIIGDPALIKQFLSTHGLPSKDLDLRGNGRVLSGASGALRAGSEAASNSGRWVKLTEKSAAALKQGTAMSGSTPTVSRAVLTENGKVSTILEFTSKSAGSVLSNPAVLTGAAGLMAQVAMQQAMDEITEYLKVIDAKVDDVLRAQKDAVLSDMIGVELVIGEALTIRQEVGRVSEVTWSKVQSTGTTVAQTQSYALRQLDAYAEKLEKAAGMGDLAKAVKATDATVQEWLAVLARASQLQDAIAVLELDRVMETAPEELDQHRRAIRIARSKRLEVIAASSARLLARIAVAGGTANSKVLLHPSSARSVVSSGNRVASTVVDFHELLGLPSSQEELEARRWVEAATDARVRAVEAVATGLEGAKRVGAASANKATSTASAATHSVAERVARLRSKKG